MFKQKSSSFVLKSEQSQRSGRYFPPGTFIPTGARVLAIIHLCIAFSVICYTLGTPFLEEVFSVKEFQSLYRAVGEDPLFATLSADERALFAHHYEQLLAYGNRSFGQKAVEAGLFIVRLPAFKMTWLFLSVIIPILLLKKREGARGAIWLLPLVTCIYCLDNFFFYPEKPFLQELQLFPTEKYLVERYLDSPLSPEFSKQREELQRAWSLYLAEEWASELPTDRQQVANGAFRFNRARLEAKERDRERLSGGTWRQPLLRLSLFFVWNLFFAIAVTFFMGRKGNCAGTKKLLLQEGSG